MWGRDPAVSGVLPPDRKIKTGGLRTAKRLTFLLCGKKVSKETHPNASACLRQVPSAPQIFGALAKLGLRPQTVPRFIAKYLLHSSGSKGGGSPDQNQNA